VNSFYKHFATYFLLSFLIFGLFESISAQEPRLPKILLDVPQDTIYTAIDSSDTTLQLPDKFIIPSSEKLHLKRFRLLNNIHYTINYREGKIELLRFLPATDSLRIIYRKYPFPLLDDYYHRELQAYVPPDTAEQQETEITAQAVKPKFLEELDSYQTNLQKSGSIVRGIEIGNNQDLTLNSGLNLQLSGKITPDVELVAALTDESTPIQPEGNTQTLQEVDKVFVKISSPYLGGTLGDFNLTYGQSLFGNLQRKLQGITVENWFKSTTQQLTYGTSRGIFHSNRFLGQEGNQGPYLLTGKNGEREIVVLAGTERVYADGVLQVRGENDDYIIDYGLAQITFTSNKLITSENRIEVDFEYTNSFQRYGRNLVGFSSRGQNVANRINYDVRVFREWDDTNNLLEDDAPLSDAEKEALEIAGNDPFKAVVPGWEKDDLGRGSYNQVDTLIITENDTITFYFKYVGQGNGDFLVRFSGVGVGNGQYIRERFGVFGFVGPGRGEYLPVRLVPLAGDKKLLDVGLGANITKTWSIRGEFSGSDYDQNVFSPIDDETNRGGAVQLTTTLQDSSMRLLGNKIGGLRLDGRWTKQEASFSPLDRPLQPEYAYKWNLGTEDLGIEENSLEFFGSYQPARFLIFQGNLGTLDKGSEFSSDRRSGQVQFLENSFLPEAKFRLEDVKSLTNFDQSNWLRRNFAISKKISIFTPRYNFNNEDRAVKNQSGGKITGFIFQDHRASLLTRKLLGLDWRFGYQYRIDDLYNPNVPGASLELSSTQTYETQVMLPQDRNLRGQFSVTLRDKDYSEYFETLPADSILLFQPDPQYQDTSWRDSQSHLANAELQYRNKSNSFNARWDYKVASELQALLEQKYIEIGNNQGNFTFDSTLNEYVPDPQGDFVLVVLPTGDFQSVIRMETAVQFQYRPIASREKLGDFGAFLNKLSFVSYFKIEEQNRGGDIWDIYLLNLSKFHNVNTTLRGAYIINQDFYYNERNPDWGGLFRMRYRDNLSNQYLDPDNNESRILLERLLEMRKRVFNRKLNLTLGYQNSRNKRWVASSPSRDLNILSQAIISRLNWRPSLSWQFQFDVERGLDNDRNSQTPLRVNYWDIKPQISYSLRGKARATANLTFIQVEDVENPANRPIPFEMGKGKKAGNSWLWSARFEYFISNNVTINANYTGRKDANALRVLHLGKAEVRAFF
jgi:hypothetical protein